MPTFWIREDKKEKDDKSETLRVEVMENETESTQPENEENEQ